MQQIVSLMLLKLNGTMKIESLELIYDFLSLLNEYQWEHGRVRVPINKGQGIPH